MVKEQGITKRIYFEIREVQFDVEGVDTKDEVAKNPETH